MIHSTKLEAESHEMYVICKREPVWSEEKPGGGLTQIIGYEDYWFMAVDRNGHTSSFFWSAKMPTFFEDVDEANSVLAYLYRWHSDMVEGENVLIEKVLRQTTTTIKQREK
jgi:hypothetical protein